MNRLLAVLLLAQGCVCLHSRRDVPRATARAAAADGTVRFAAFGDTGLGNLGQYKVADAVARQCAALGCDFVLLLGDNLYRGGASGPDDPQWQTKFEKPYELLDLPFYAVLGNHDYGDDGLGDDFPRGANEVAYTGHSTRWRMPAAHYRFRAGVADFFALDTTLALWGKDGDQAAEIAGWVADSKATWKIAFGHHTYLSNGKHGNAGNYQGYGEEQNPQRRGDAVKALLDKAVCGKADLYLAGHDHNLQWLEPTCGGTELVVSGAGAEFVALRKRNRARFEQAALGFLYVVAGPKELTAEFIGDDNHALFSRTLRRQGSP